MTKNELAGLLHNALFGSRQDINQALGEAITEVGDKNSTCASRVMDVHVLMNTIANEVMQLENITSSHYVLQAHAKHGRVVYGVFWTKAQAEEELDGLVENSSIDADYWELVEWCRTEVLNRWQYERVVTFKEV